MKLDFIISSNKEKNPNYLNERGYPRPNEPEFIIKSAEVILEGNAQIVSAVLDTLQVLVKEKNWNF